MLSRQERFGKRKKNRQENEESDVHITKEECYDVEEGNRSEETQNKNAEEFQQKQERLNRKSANLDYGSKRPDRNTKDHNYGSNRTGRRTGEFVLKENEHERNKEKKEYNQKYHQEYVEEPSKKEQAQTILRPYDESSYYEYYYVYNERSDEPGRSHGEEPGKKKEGNHNKVHELHESESGKSRHHSKDKRRIIKKQKSRPTWVFGFIAIIIIGLVGYLSVDNMVLRNANEKLNSQLVKATSSPDLDVEYGDLMYGSAGKPISPLYPEMVIDWREDPVYTPLQPTVYLTFDDGPSNVTPQILDTLDAYGIKATFFVIGKKDEKLSAYYKEIVDRGHTLAMHSWTHQYNTIYASVDNFLTDYVQLYNWLYEKTGVKPELYRYPGGTTNNYANKKFGTFDQIKKEMDSRGFIYYDWNVSSGDAVGKNVDPDVIIQNVVNGVKGKQYAVVLMHDSSTKETTATALPRMIEELAAMGYHFDRITTDMAPIQFK